MYIKGQVFSDILMQNYISIISLNASWYSNYSRQVLNIQMLLIEQQLSLL